MKSSKFFRRLGLLLVLLFLFMLALTVIYPFLWMIISSFKDNTELYLSPWSLPRFPVVDHPSAVHIEGEAAAASANQIPVGVAVHHKKLHYRQLAAAEQLGRGMGGSVSLTCSGVNCCNSLEQRV